jgi:hypothetical protein
VENTYPAAPQTSFADGTYVVGAHVAAGTYRAGGTPGGNCYWARLRDFSGSVSSIVANGLDPTIVTVSPSDTGFTTFGCGTWTRQ